MVTSNLPDGSPDAIATIVNTSALEASSDGTTSALANSGSPTSIRVTWHCKAKKAVTNADSTGHTAPTDTASDAITVHIDYTFVLITPFFGNQTLHITADEVGRAEY